jgi:hypothetical protein
VKETPDKVFISYSWSSPEHKDWVMELAERLVDDNVDVVIDEWDTKEGQDLNKFMERMVNDPSIDKVLVISDRIYAEKADGRHGGVGTETTIASAEVYRDADQKKFFAIVTEMDEDGQAYQPTFLRGKKYINMSTPQDYEEGYRRLIRNLYHKPEYQRPEKGKAPEWLLKDEKKSLLNSTVQLRSLKSMADKRPHKLDVSFKQFISAFYEDYKSFAKSFEKDSNHVELAYESYQEMQDLRDIFIEALETYIINSDDVNPKLLITFYEEIYPLIKTREQTQHGYFEAQFDHMKMFVSELMIYSIAILLEHEKYSVIEALIKNRYFMIDDFGREVEGKINEFQFYPDFLRNYINSKQEMISPLGELLSKRATYSQYPFSSIVEAELLIYMLLYFYDSEEEYDVWFPYTSPYLRKDRISFIRRLRSKRHFEEVNKLFNVETAEEMKEKLSAFYKYFKGMARSGGRGIPSLFQLIDVEEVAKY